MQSVYSAAPVSWANADIEYCNRFIAIVMVSRLILSWAEMWYIYPLGKVSFAKFTFIHRVSQINVWTLWFIMNTIFIHIYLSFIIELKEDKYRIFWGNAGVRTDDRSLSRHCWYREQTELQALLSYRRCSNWWLFCLRHRWNCKLHKSFKMVFGCILFHLQLLSHWLLKVSCYKVKWFN